MEYLFGCTTRINSPLHKLDARVKLLAILGYIVIITTLSSFFALALGIIFLLALALLSRVELVMIIKRLLWIFPFAGALVVIFPFITPGDPVWQARVGMITLTATAQGLSWALVLALRVLNAVLALTLLTATTSFRELMQTFRDLRVPAVFVQTIEFMVRYILVLVDEANRMRVARQARCFKKGRSLLDYHTVKTLGQMIGVLFLRSCGRGERVYLAMLARGFSSVTVSRAGRNICVRDVGWGALIAVVAVCLWLAEAGVYKW
ncbi:MAG: cobalt ECF transporter T component CbiQ [Bacillota bacterium]